MHDLNGVTQFGRIAKGAYCQSGVLSKRRIAKAAYCQRGVSKEIGVSKKGRTYEFYMGKIKIFERASVSIGRR